MSASKDIQQKLARKRRWKQAAQLDLQRKRRERWARGLFPGSTVRLPAPGGVKMYVVLEDFVEPFADEVEGIEEYRRLLCLGQLAWNAALRSQPERGRFVNEMLSAGMPGANQETLSMGRTIIEALIARKERHFAHLLRPILAFELIDTGDGWHLNVASAVV